MRSAVSWWGMEGLSGGCGGVRDVELRGEVQECAKPGSAGVFFAAFGSFTLPVRYLR